jgi:hypothetical protein
MDGLPVVSLSVDYRIGMPLSGDFKSLDLPGSLLDSLCDWQQFFDDHFDPYNDGWDTAESKTHWTERAEDLVLWLRREVLGRAELEVNLWPIEETGQRLSQIAGSATTFSGGSPQA